MISYIFLLVSASAFTPLTPQQLTGVLSLVYPGQTDPNSKPIKSVTNVGASSCALFEKTLGNGFITSCGTDLCSSTCFSSVESILTGSSLTQLIKVCQPTLAEAKNILENFSKITAKCGPISANDLANLLGDQNPTSGTSQPSAGQNAGTSSLPGSNGGVPVSNTGSNTGVTASSPGSITGASNSGTFLQAPKAPGISSSGFIAQASMIGMLGAISQIIL